MKKTSFIAGTIILILVNVIVRSLGFIYKILLSRLIGATAIGLYQMVFPFLMMIITLPTAGLPIAVSKLIAEEKAHGRREGVYRILFFSLVLGFLLSLILSILVSFNIDYIINNLFKNPDLYYPILWTIPSICIITFSNILRGFFYGLKEIAPAASAQIIEQVLRIIFILSYLYYRPPTNPIMAATIAIIGIFIGELCGLLYLILKLNFFNMPASIKAGRLRKALSCHIMGSLLFIAIPITISRLISVLMQTVNSILIPQKLQILGYSPLMSLEIFGKISGMAMPLLFLPFTVTNALVLNIIPNISEQLAVNNWSDIENKTSLAIKITLLVAIPTSLVYGFFGQHICRLIYAQEGIGDYLYILNWGLIFLCLQHTSSGILHGIGKQVITTINYILGMLIQLYCTYFLIPNPKYGIKGYFIGFLLSTFLIFGLNFLVLARHIRLQINISKSLILPLLASVTMVIIIGYSYRALYILLANNGLSFILSLGLGGCFYFLFLSVSKSLDIKYILQLIKR